MTVGFYFCYKAISTKQMMFCAREKVGRLGRDKEGNVFLHGTMIIEVGHLVIVIMLMMVDLQTTRSRSIIKRYNKRMMPWLHDGDR